MQNSFNDDVKIMENMTEFAFGIKEIEEDFMKEQEQSEAGVAVISEGVQGLTQVTVNYPDVFGADERDVVTGMNTLVAQITKLVGKLRASQANLSVVANAMPNSESFFKEASSNLKAITTQLRNATTEVGKTRKMLVNLADMTV